MEPDLTQLSPAALDAWLGECERQADHSISGRTIAALVRYVRTLANFKAYVHRRLDEAGVPVDPESPHKAQGCRIGGRLDVVLGERAALAARVAEAKRRLNILEDFFRETEPHPNAPSWLREVAMVLDGEIEIPALAEETK